MVTKAQAEQMDRLAQLHRDWRDPKKNHPERVEKLTKTWKRDDGSQGSMTLDYVGHANLRDILCSTDPLWTWAHAGPADSKGNPTPLIDKDAKGWSRGLWINLTIHGLTKPGYGSCAAGKPDAVKELIGDALRNAAQSFGIAIALWVKSDLADIGDWERLAQLEAEEAGETPPEDVGEESAAPAPTTPQTPTQPSQNEAPAQSPAADGQCPECHGPGGRHASSCSRKDGATQGNGNGQGAVNESLTPEAPADDPAQLSGDDLKLAVGKRIAAMRGPVAVKFAEEKKRRGWPGDLTAADDDLLRRVLAWLLGQPVERVVSGS